MKELPKTLYIRRQEGGSGNYFTAGETIREQCDLKEARTVGVYTLVEMLEVTAEVNTVRTPNAPDQRPGATNV